VTCSIAAAVKYGIPTNIMLAVAEIEGGRPGLRVLNRDGSFDIGPMQFNTRYLEQLGRRYGITAQDVATAGCYPYDLAAWRLRKHLELDDRDAWTRAANYHSRSPAENSTYRAKLIAKAATWARWLAVRFETREIGRAIAAPAKRTRESRTVHGSSNSDRDGEDSELASLLEQLEDCGSTYESRRVESPSAGLPHARTLLGGVQLPPHPAYRLIDPSRAWGTSGTISSLVEAFDEFVATGPAAPRVEVHDLSLPRGGQMRGHRSHQTGRDVDITYYQRTSHGICAGRQVRPDELDALREWRLLRHWLDRGQAEFIFIDYALQRPLYEVAKTNGATERQLAEWFQYPRGAEVRAGIIRHIPNHANHVHVRFRCAPRDRACRGTSRTLEPPVEADLLELLAE
jgi:murein endopeptidase